MAKNIALTLTLNGVQQTIQTITQLEETLNTARQELNKLTIGSSEFKKLQREIQFADTALKNMRKEAEGIELEKQIGDFAKLGATITGGFAAAQAAMSLFGTESTQVAEAAAKAQQTLTIALFARDAAEGALAVKTVALTVATKAQTAADTVQIGVLKKLFAVIAANPYTALAVAIGAVVTAVYLLVTAETEQEKQAKKAKEANDAYIESLKVAGAQSKIVANQVGFLVSFYEDGILPLNQFKAGIDKLVPGLKNVDLTTKAGRTTLNNYVKLLNELGVVQDKIAGKTTEFGEALKNNNVGRQRDIRLELQFLSLEQAKYQEQLNLIEQQDKKIEEDRNKREKQRNDRIQRRIELLNRELDLYKKRLEIERGELDVLTQAAKFTPAEAQIVQLLEKRYETQKSLNESLNEYLPLTQQIQDGLMKIYDIPTDTALDSFIDLKTQFTDLITGFQTGEITLEKFNEELNKTGGELTKEGGPLSKLVNKEALENITSAIQNLKTLAFILEDFRKAGIQFPDFGTFTTEIRNIYTELDQPFIDPKREQELKGRLKEIEVEFQKSYLEIQKKTKEFEDARKKILDASALKKTLEGADLTKITDEETKALQELDEQFKVTGSVIFKNLSQGVIELKNFEEGVKGVAENVIDLKNKIKELQTPELAAFLIKNKELLTNAYTVNLGEVEDNRQRLLDLQKEIQNKTFDQESMFLSEVEQLEYTFAQAGINISELTYEQKLVLLEAFLKKEVEVTEDAEKKKQEAQEKTRNKILDGIQQFQQALNAIQQTVSDYYNFQFEQLEKRNKRVQDTIVGDSEEANRKRLEADKIYQAERERLEKKQARTSLGIQLLQAIANAATAITLVTAQTGVLAPIAAGIVAASSAAQIGIITAQINALDKYKRGGRLKFGGGGFVSGPSHEYGGVKYQGGGVELEGNESIINRVSTIRYQDLLSQINMNGGGRPIINNNFDDSRIVEAIAKQRQEPIKAYVVESDITGKQTVTRRLEQLSQL